jgi:hypothetical protein
LPGVYSNVSGTKESTDATIFVLSSSHPAHYEGRLTGILEKWIFRDSAGTLVACQFTTEGGAVSTIEVKYNGNPEF